jgi:hypothetical protein
MTNQINSNSITNLLAELDEYNPGNLLYDVLPLDNVSFGGTTDTLRINSVTYDFITSLSLRVTLPIISSVNWSTGGKGYISWINNIGHGIIDGIELKLDQQIIYDMGFPYDKWLDIYNELNDTNMSEAQGIGKKTNSIENNQYQLNKVVLDIPLHLWFSNNIKSALPMFMMDDIDLQFKLKLKSFAGLHVYNPSGNSGNVTAVTPTVDLVVGYFDLTDLTMKNTLKTQNYSYFFNYYTNTAKTVATTNSISSNESLPLKEIQFVLMNSTRDSSNSGSGPYKINRLVTDTNKNDYFNYGSTTILSGNTDYDTFTTMNIKFDNQNYYNSSVGCNFLRTTAISENHNRVPLPKSNKYIYCLPFTPNANADKIQGALDFQYIDSISLDFAAVSTSYKMYVFFNHIKKISINSGKLLFDNWTASEVGTTQSAFKEVSGDVTIVQETIVSQQRQQSETAQLSVIAYDSQDSTAFMAYEYSVVNGSLVIDFIIGDNINPDAITDMQSNLYNGSVKIDDYLLSVESMDKLELNRKIPNALRVRMKTLIATRINEGIVDIKTLFADILAFSKGFYITTLGGQLQQFDYWIDNDDIIKSIEETAIDDYLNRLYFYNQPFNSRAYRLTVDNIIHVSNGKYNANIPPNSVVSMFNTKLSSELTLEDKPLVLLRWSTKLAEIPYITIIPAKLNPLLYPDSALIQDISVEEIIDQFGVFIPVDANKEINYQTILDNLKDVYKSRLDEWYTKTLESEGTAKFKHNLARLDKLQDYSQVPEGEYLSDAVNKNFFSIMRVTNVTMVIPNTTNTTVSDINTKLKNVNLTKLKLSIVESPKITFDFSDTL